MDALETTNRLLQLEREALFSELTIQATEARELRAENERLKELHRRNVHDCEKYIRERDSHHCGWRVTLEGILERSHTAIRR